MKHSGIVGMFVTRLCSAIAAMLLVLAVSCPLDAQHMVLRFNLEEMTVTADRVFPGRCVGVEETQEMIVQGPLPITRYTFEVERAIKGRLPRSCQKHSASDSGESGQGV